MDSIYRKQTAFSLVELSIVLVILGLLVGGVLSGQALIRASEMRSITAQANQYRAAIYSFRDKYFAIPGDMANATSFWGQAGTGYSGACPGTSATPSTDTGTCNGDGNGGIGLVGGTYQESFRFWQQLANAGLIEGSYTGTTSSAAATTYKITIGVNVPRAKVSGTGYSIQNYGTQTSNPNYFDGEYGHVFWIGSDNGTYTAGVSFLPEEAWNIDTKLDDGKPSMGMLKTQQSITNCWSGTGVADAVYQLSTSSKTCNIMYRLGF
jgi:prepilin-type N-terminal cleavage/methylation domain-containing protein